LPKIATVHNIVILKEGAYAIAFRGKGLCRALRLRLIPAPTPTRLLCLITVNCWALNKVKLLNLSLLKTQSASLCMHITKSLCNDASGNGSKVISQTLTTNQQFFSRTYYKLNFSVHYPNIG